MVIFYSKVIRYAKTHERALRALNLAAQCKTITTQDYAALLADMKQRLTYGKALPLT